MNTPNTNTTILERVDVSSGANAVRLEWEILRHLLHLPSAESLQGGGLQALVASNIVQAIQHVRGSINMPALQQQLQMEYTIEAHQLSQSPLSAQGLHYAEAWLQVLHSHLTDADMRALIERLPPAIRMVDGSNRWRANRVPIGGNARNLTVDLSHPIWRSGGEEDIGRRLIDKTLAECGIVAGALGGNYVLTEQDVDAIFDSKSNIIDPTMPMMPVQVNITIGGTEHLYTFNIPNLLRDYPTLAGQNFTNLTTSLNAFSPNELERYVSLVDRATGAVLSPHPLNGGVNVKLANALHKVASDPFFSKELSLSAAIERRSATDRLLASTADSRELALALTTLQRDPTALDALQAGSTKKDNLVDEIRQNQLHLRAASAMEALGAESAPAQSEADCLATKTMLTKLMQNVQAVYSLSHGDQADLFAATITLVNTSIGTPLDPPERNMANRMGLGQTLTRINEPQTTLPNGAIVAARDNNAQIAQYVTTLQEKLTEQSATLDHINRLAQHISALGALLSQYVEATKLPAREYPLINHVLELNSKPYTVKKANIDATLNMPVLKEEVETALLTANSRKPFSLQEASVYRDKAAKLAEQLSAVDTEEDALNGSDACWAIVRRSLEHQGLRGEELENTLGYMQVQAERTPESVRDTTALVEATYPAAGVDDHEAAQDYNAQHSFRTLGFPRIYNQHGLHSMRAARFNALEEYQNRLFRRDAIGVSMPLTPLDRGQPLSQLIDAYFRTKHLMQLPSSDPKHLPESRLVLQLLRDLHRLILERAQQNMNYASGMKREEMKALSALGVGGAENQDLGKMTMTDRVQAVHDFLRDGTQYWEGRTSEIEKIAERAYAPVRARIARHNAIMNAIKGDAPWYTGVAIPGKVVRKSVGMGVKAVKGTASLTKKGVTGAAKGVWNNKGSLALGAVAGSFIIPIPGVGAGIGMLAAPMVKKMFSSPS